MNSATSANVDISKFFSPGNLEAIRTGALWKRDDFVLLRMLEEGAHADITFTTRDQGCVKAHRSVLACVSPVFDAIFQQDMKEQVVTSTVKIDDMTTDGWQLFLLLLYATTELELGKCAQVMPRFWFVIGAHYAELCTAFHRYQVKLSGFRPVLESALVRFLSVENCLDHYTNLLQLESDPELCELLKVTENYIVGNYNRVVESRSFFVEMKRNPRQVYQLIKSAEPPDCRAAALQRFHANKAKLRIWFDS